jgi:hypothetical protein
VRKRGPGLAAVVLAATLAPPAGAAELSYEDGLLSYRTEPGTADYLRVDVRSTHLVVEASAAGGSTTVAVTAGPGCVPAPGPYAPDEVPNLFLCRRDDRDLRLATDLGDGDDFLLAEQTIRARVTGGEGDDHLDASGTIDGGPGDDSLSGDDPDAGRLRLLGGPGDDTLLGHNGPELLQGGPGRDEFDLRGQDGVSDHDPDVVDARDGEIDVVSCATSERSDRLLLDGYDWPRRDRRGRCNGLRRSSPARALPTDIFTAAEETGGGTEVLVYCPHDVPHGCRGTITAAVAGDHLGPARFAARPGRSRYLRMSRLVYDTEACEDVPARVTVRTRRARRVLTVTADMMVRVCPFDSS